MPPIGITFMPTADAQAEGPRRGQMEGDLQQAFKILSLNLPRVQGARALAPQRLLESPGASGFPGTNPHAAVFEALLKASAGGRQDLFNAIPQPGTGGPAPTPMPSGSSAPTATAAPVARQSYDPAPPAPATTPIARPYDAGPASLPQPTAAPPPPHIMPSQGPGAAPYAGPTHEPTSTTGVKPWGSNEGLGQSDAIDYLNRTNRGLGGQDLTPAQLNEAAQFIGYNNGGSVTGAQLNQLVAEMFRRAGRPGPF